MKLNMLLSALVMVLSLARPVAAQQGVLLLAHGGQPEWNTRVTDLASKVDRQTPTEVAFGMATRANIQDAIDRLVARGVKEIVAVPLFVSSWSSVITSTEYLLGLRAEAPAALAAFARMGHGVAHAGHADPDATRPVKSAVPIRMSAAFNDHPIVADVLLSRARAISQKPGDEVLVLVAHGPNEEADNERWLADLASLGRQIAAKERFAAVAHLTVRDDAPKPVWEKAKAELRETVERHTAAGRRVLVVPVLVSFGGIEKGIGQRLDGLTYTMTQSALVPDDRLVSWVLEMARKSS